MKIAQIAPLSESCPPQFYGGTERIVYYMTEELVRQGHEVTLFASGDSRTTAELVSCCEMGLRLNSEVQNPLPHQIAMLEHVRKRERDFDILHFHIDFIQFPMISPFANKTVTTLHGRLDLPDLPPFFSAFRNVPLSSISYHQRIPVPSCARWAGNVYHGLPRDRLPFSPAPKGGYLAFLGRISPEKRPDRAIEIAARTGMPLKIAAKIDKVDHAYWREKIEPMIKATPGVEYIGEINEQQKGAFLGDAAALLFPIDWPEPFGLVMIEAMACGTPVIAFRCGSVSEVVDDGVSGYVVESIDEAVKAVSRLPGLDRAGVRAAFENRFTAERMAKDYIKIYQSLIGQARQETDYPRRINGHDLGMRLPI
ncbi:glycosyltransferase family 4 protein [Rhodomicrobium sp. Az07]|uniref:glycosyltransferase family 4 protein n=1 Tax=Rhodomicrobium sp. Az07 TaxID=2839034 RepID=UPI001BE5AEC1|nr:glycosyltransferase family 4 protein [Rhodomicrobium sp. Az07]MBT3071651.1 glycosyltransferase family 4 protein [Rhodomicrobium sp. Az07]